MTIDEARKWLHGVAAKAMASREREAQEAYEATLTDLDKNRCQNEKMDTETAIRLLRFELNEHYPDLPGFRKLREAMQMAIDAMEQTRWVPVAELPPKKDKFILCSDGVTVSAGVLSANGWVTTEWNRNVQPVYWMPSPKLPVE